MVCSQCLEEFDGYYFGFFDSEYRDQEQRFCTLDCSVKWIKSRCSNKEAM